MQVGSDDGVVAIQSNEETAGKTLGETKVRYTWVLSVDGEKRRLDFTNSKTSGMKRLFVDGRLQHEQRVFRSPHFQYTWPIGNHLLSIVPKQGGLIDCEFELRINGRPFKAFKQRTQAASRDDAASSRTQVALQGDSGGHESLTGSGGGGYTSMLQDGESMQRRDYAQDGGRGNSRPQQRLAAPSWPTRRQSNDDDAESFRSFSGFEGAGGAEQGRLSAFGSGLSSTLSAASPSRLVAATKEKTNPWLARARHMSQPPMCREGRREGDSDSDDMRGYGGLQGHGRLDSGDSDSSGSATRRGGSKQGASSTAVPTDRQGASILRDDSSEDSGGGGGGGYIASPSKGTGSWPAPSLQVTSSSSRALASAPTTSLSPTGSGCSHWKSPAQSVDGGQRSFPDAAQSAQPWPAMPSQPADGRSRRKDPGPAGASGGQQPQESRRKTVPLAFEACGQQARVSRNRTAPDVWQVAETSASSGSFGTNAKSVGQPWGWPATDSSSTNFAPAEPVQGIANGARAATTGATLHTHRRVVSAPFGSKAVIGVPGASFAIGSGETGSPSPHPVQSQKWPAMDLFASTGGTSLAAALGEAGGGESPSRRPSIDPFASNSGFSAVASVSQNAGMQSTSLRQKQPDVWASMDPFAKSIGTSVAATSGVSESVAASEASQPTALAQLWPGLHSSAHRGGASDWTVVPSSKGVSSSSSVGGRSAVAQQRVPPETRHHNSEQQKSLERQQTPPDEMWPSASPFAGPSGESQAKHHNSEQQPRLASQRAPPDAMWPSAQPLVGASGGAASASQAEKDNYGGSPSGQALLPRQLEAWPSSSPSVGSDGSAPPGMQTRAPRQLQQPQQQPPVWPSLDAGETGARSNGGSSPFASSIGASQLGAWPAPASSAPFAWPATSSWPQTAASVSAAPWPPNAATPVTLAAPAAPAAQAVATPLVGYAAKPEGAAAALPSAPVSSSAQVVHATQATMPTRPPRQRAVLVGINYFHTEAELRGCINDVHNMRRLLADTFGWPGSCVRTLTDDDPSRSPTRANIEDALRWLVEGVCRGDVLLFHFSGHGAQKEDPHGYEEDGMNETVCPVDFQRSGMLTDDEIGDMIVKHLPEGVRLTAVMDCCHSGTGLDLPFTWSGQSWHEETNPYHSRGDVQLFSGCEDEDTSADAMGPGGSAGGAMTTAFCDLLRSGCAGLPYAELLSRLHDVMRRRGFTQRPQLTSSQAFDHQRPFLLDDIVPNSNREIGRKFRKKFPPRPRRRGGPLYEMIDDPMLLMAVGGAALTAGSMVSEAALAGGSAVLGRGGGFSSFLGALLE